MDRLTTRHCGVAVIKDKSKLIEAMEKLAAYEDAEEKKLQYKPGDEVWCIEGCEGDFELCGYLFMAMCGEFAIVVPKWISYKSFEEQLTAMEEESQLESSVAVAIFDKKMVFLSKEKAEMVFDQLLAEASEE